MERAEIEAELKGPDEERAEWDRVNARSMDSLRSMGILAPPPIARR